MRPAEKTVTVRGNHGSEQSRVYPHRLQITLHRSSTVGAPHTSQASPTPGRASSGALSTVADIEESTAPGSLNPFSTVRGVNRRRTRPGPRTGGRGTPGNRLSRNPCFRAAVAHVEGREAGLHLSEAPVRDGASTGIEAGRDDGRRNLD